MNDIRRVAQKQLEALSQLKGLMAVLMDNLEREKSIHAITARLAWEISCDACEEGIDA